MLSLVLVATLGGCSTELLKCRANAPSAADLEACEKKSGCAAPPSAACAGLDWQCVAACTGDDACLTRCASKACEMAAAAYRKCSSGAGIGSTSKCDDACVKAFGLQRPKYERALSSGVSVSEKGAALPPELVGTWVDFHPSRDRSDTVMVVDGKQVETPRRTLRLMEDGTYLEDVEVRRELGPHAAVLVSAAGLALLEKGELTLRPLDTSAVQSLCSTDFGPTSSLAPPVQKYRFKVDAAHLTLEGPAGKRVLTKK